MPREPRRPRPPARLGEAGSALWRDVVGVYVLTAPELRLLEAACSSADAVATLEAQVESDGLMVEGSKGQPTLHPAVAEARLSRLALGRLLGQLALPDPEGGTVRTPAQQRAQRAAQARWRAQRRREEAS